MRSIIRFVKSELDDVLLRLPASPSLELALLLGAMISGIIVGMIMPSAFMPGLFLAGIPLIVIGLASKPRAWLLMAFGIALVSASRGSFAGLDRVALSGSSESRVFRGTISGFPRITSTQGTAVVDVGFPLRVTAKSMPERGSEVEFSCPPKAKNAAFACEAKDLRITREPGRLIRSLNAIREAAYAKTHEYLPQTEAALLSGMVYGGDEALPYDTRLRFRNASLSHLVAVSGANLSVVTDLLYGVLIAVVFSRRGAALVSAGALALVVLFVGADPSVVRAAIMGAVLLLGYFIGRPRSGVNALLLAAATMLAVDPWLVYDIGFLLSVSATFGLLVLARPIEARLPFIPAFGGIRNALATVVAATASTFPVLALMLGRFSITSPFANLLAAPFAAAIFSLGIAWFCLLWWPSALYVLALPLKILLDGLLFIAALFGG